MIRALVAAAVVLLSLSNAAHAQDVGCLKDTDCKGSRICVDHACIDPPPVKSCARDLDCPGDDICEQHLCLPPANAKKVKGKKPSRRDLIKEAEVQAAREAAAKAAEPPPPAPAPVQAAPAPLPAPAPVATPPPAPPPQLITETKPAETPAPAPAQPPAPPPDLLMTPPPPPPLVAAAAPPPPPVDTSSGDFSPGFVAGIGLTAGIHVWSAGASETDFGLDLNGDLGVLIFRNFGVEVLAQGSYTPMLASRTGLLASIGLGVRLENLGPIPGHFLLGGAGSFAAISASDVATINVSGGSMLLQYSLPIAGYFEGQGQMGLHFLSDGAGGSLTLFTLTLGIAFGN